MSSSSCRACRKALSPVPRLGWASVMIQRTPKVPPSRARTRLPLLSLTRGSLARAEHLLPSPSPFPRLSPACSPVRPTRAPRQTQAHLHKHHPRQRNRAHSMRGCKVPKRLDEDGLIGEVVRRERNRQGLGNELVVCTVIPGRPKVADGQPGLLDARTAEPREGRRGKEADDGEIWTHWG